MGPILNGYGVMTVWNLEQKVTIIDNKPSPYSVSVEIRKLDWVGESAGKINACNANSRQLVS